MRFLSNLTCAAIYLIIFTASTLTLAVQFSVHIQVCGSELPNHYNWICAQEVDNLRSEKRTSKIWSSWWDEPFTIRKRKYHRQFENLTKSQIKKNANLFRGIADECCLKSCSLETFAAYCFDPISRTTVAERGMTKICPSLTTSQDVGQETSTPLPSTYTTFISRRPATLHSEPRRTQPHFDTNIF